MTLEEILDEIETNTIQPERAADLLPSVAVKYARAADNYIVANAKFAQAFTDRREDYKSDTATERYLEKDEIGLTRHHWKYQMKKCETLLKALNGFIYQKTAEAKNQM
jgi:hypothetical protein